MVNATAADRQYINPSATFSNKLWAKNTHDLSISLEWTPITIPGIRRQFELYRMQNLNDLLQVWEMSSCQHVMPCTQHLFTDNSGRSSSRQSASCRKKSMPRQSIRTCLSLRSQVPGKPEFSENFDAQDKVFFCMRTVESHEKGCVSHNLHTTPSIWVTISQAHTELTILF